MEPPHVVCFSNELPCLALQSMDRWRIFKLEDKQSPLAALSLGQVAEIQKAQQVERNKRKAAEMQGGDGDGGG